jgi:hypothetical protein
VSVGVTKIRRLFALDFDQNIPHAPRKSVALVLQPEARILAVSPHACTTLVELHEFFESRDIGEIGHITGNVIQYGENHISIRVSAPRRGIPSSTRNPSPIGYQKATGSPPGASGAQLTG